MQAPLVFFIHGLNTFGDDKFHIGPLALGPMYRHWKPEFENAGCEFIPINEMGFGSFDDQIDRAVRQIERVLAQSSQADSVRAVHLFGHSMGGLVARGVGARLLDTENFRSRAKLQTIMTLGTPHEGTIATEGALDLQKNHLRFFQALKFVGYNIDERREAFRHFTIDQIKAFTGRHPLLDGVDCVSFIGAVPRKKLGWPFQLIYSRLHTAGNSELSDGLIAESTQRWGRIGGTFELDHGAELGQILNLSPRQRRLARLEFQRLVQVVVSLVSRRDVP